MGSFSNQQSTPAGVGYSEAFVSALGSRYGFRTRDYSLRWDGGQFQSSLEVHELAIVAADGRTVTAQIDDRALMHQDPWKYMRDIENAFAKLTQRKVKRGL